MFWGSNWLWGLPLLVTTVVVHVAMFMIITRALIPEIIPSKRSLLISSCRWRFLRCSQQPFIRSKRSLGLFST